MRVHMYMNAKRTGMFACIFVHVYMFTCTYTINDKE